jgi:hypothetical protein
MRKELGACCQFMMSRRSASTFVWNENYLNLSRITVIPIAVLHGFVSVTSGQYSYGTLNMSRPLPPTLLRTVF